MEYETIKTEYLCYLMNRIGLEAEGDHGYLKLCETLHSIGFIPLLEMDENRCDECRKLRHDFEEYGRIENAGDILDGVLWEDGTMMELLTVLAERMNYEMSDSQFEASPRKWFLEMIANCGLEKNCENCAFEDADTEYAVIAAMDAVILRRIDWDGSNGLFPLNNPRYDQRDVELHIQLNNYLEEHYDIL